MTFRAVLVAVLALAGIAASATARSVDAVKRVESRLPAPASAASTDRLLSGETVRVDSAVEGDLAAAGREVAINAAVAGYALLAGRTVQVRSSVADDLWAAGVAVVLDAPVGDNARLAGREVRLESNTRIDGDARIAARSVVLAPGALVRGDLIVHAAQPPQISPEAQVLGEVHYGGRGWERDGFAGWLTSWLFWFLALVTVGFAALWLFPLWAGRATRALHERPGASALAGIAALVLAPIAAALLVVTVIGIPLALIVLALYVIAIVLAGALVSYRLGNWLLAPGRSRPWPRMALGAAAVSFAVSLPWIGWLAQILVLVLGFGALALERWAAVRQPAL